MSTIPRRVGARPRRWTKEEYYRLGELGFFNGQRVELIEGKLMVQCPQGPPHADRVDRAGDVLRAVFGTGYRVRVQLPIDFGQTTEPEPDFAVVADGAYQNSHPTSALLIVEVSDTTLAYDRGRKGSLYARAGIADYWIVNLKNRQVEVYRDPVPDPSWHYGYRYGSQTDFVPPATISPLALPGASIAVAELLG